MDEATDGRQRRLVLAGAVALIVALSVAVVLATTYTTGGPSQDVRRLSLIGIVLGQGIAAIPATAKTHVSRTILKLGARDRAGIVVMVVLLTRCMRVSLADGVLSLLPRLPDRRGHPGSYPMADKPDRHLQRNAYTGRLMRVRAGAE